MIIKYNKKWQGHIKPCNTRIINHHVYRHTFTPSYTSCEENVVENVFDRGCC